MAAQVVLPFNLGKDECIIEVTTTLGLEELVKQECEQVLNVSALIRPGRVTFQIQIKNLQFIYKLRSIERFGVVIGTKSMHFTPNKVENLTKIKQLIHNLHWENGISVWRVWRHLKEENNLISNELKFRVSCNRHGIHNFDSMIAASEVGSEINVKFNWKIDLENYDLEFLLNIHENDVGFAISLTKNSLYRRNIRYFGHTTLKSTIAHSMLRLSGIKENDVICDPLCGSGSIPIEGKICWPSTHMICGDLHKKEIERTKKNIDFVNNKFGFKLLNIELFQWDARNLPLQNEGIDAIVTDLPFGKRTGNRFINQQLYPQIFSEFARVLNPKNGRAVVITADSTNLENAVDSTKNYFSISKKINIMIGGIHANIFLLLRKCVYYTRL